MVDIRGWKKCRASKDTCRGSGEGRGRRQTDAGQTCEDRQAGFLCCACRGQYRGALQAGSERGRVIRSTGGAPLAVAAGGTGHCRVAAAGIRWHARVQHMRAGGGDAGQRSWQGMTVGGCRGTLCWWVRLLALASSRRSCGRRPVSHLGHGGGLSALLIAVARLAPLRQGRESDGGELQGRRRGAAWVQPAERPCAQAGKVRNLTPVHNLASHVTKPSQASKSAHLARLVGKGCVAVAVAALKPAVALLAFRQRGCGKRSWKHTV